ncbi:MAG: arginase family protein, partial [Spirochaetes bacterium]|nr:arginase family protein [Spirochaetota bacterium]
MFGKNFSSFLESETEPKSAGNAFFHVIPVPCEKTVSYGKGTAKGPSAILNASNQLESFDGYSNPSELGIFTSEPVECKGSIEKILENVEKTVSKTLA